MKRLNKAIMKLITAEPKANKTITFSRICFTFYDPYRKRLQILSKQVYRIQG